MSTISQWTVTYLMHSTLLIAAVAIAARFLRSASARDTLWKLALVGAFVTATVQTMVPARNTITFENAQWSGGLQPAVHSGEVSPAPRQAEARRSTGAEYIPIAYGAIAAFLLARIVIGRRRFLAQIADRVELTPTPELAAHRVRLTQSHAIGSPVAMLGREIVLPADIVFTDEQRETILAHELAHLLRRDPLWLTVAEVVKALFFVQPLHWLVAAKMKETAEFLCDDAAVLRTQNPKALAETLAELAAHAGPASPAVAAMAENGSNLIARVTRVLRSHPRLPLTLRVRFAIAATVIGATVLLAPGFGIARTMTHTRKFNYFSDATLSQSFQGPEGQTQVRFAAHEAEVALDGSSVAFRSRDGFIRATMRTDAATRIIEVTPGPDLSPRYLYTYNGGERPWDDDARLTMIAGFRGEGLFAGAAEPKAVSRVEPKARPKAVSKAEPKAEPTPEAKKETKWSTWSGRVELTGTKDHVPTHLTIDIRNIRFDERSGRIEISGGDGMDVVERLGDNTRTFTLRSNKSVFSGRWDGGESPEEWLRRLLIEQTKSDPRMVEAVVNY